MKYKKYWRIVALLFVLIMIYLSSFYNYLLFHGIVETTSVLIAGCVFFFAWNSREYLKSNYLLFVGIAYFFIGTLDMAHTFAYKGMGVFTGIDANHPTQLWIAARYMESITLLLAFQFFKRKLNPYFQFGSYFLITSLIISSVFYWEVFPDCFIEGSGLTVFKKTSEYLISVILLAVIVYLYRYRSQFDKNIHRLLVASAIFTIIAELAFTFYVSVFGLSNLIGHMFKFVSFYLIYRAIVITGLKEPFSLLLREVKQSEDQLKASLKEKGTLLQEIHHRVKNNMSVISGLLNLQMNNTDNKIAREALQDSQNRVQSMSMIHETLYRSDNLSVINIKAYLSELGRIIIQNYSISHKVQFKVEAESIMISVKQASPVGLIVNELITNCLKYAFTDDREGEILLELKLKEENGVKLVVSDNGVGIPEGFDLKTADSLGLKLVKMLVENQLDGSVDVENNNGTKFTIKFNTET